MKAALAALLAGLAMTATADPARWEAEVAAAARAFERSMAERDPAGTPAARFNSVWRQEAPGVWRVVFDRGEPLPARP